MPEGQRIQHSAGQLGVEPQPLELEIWDHSKERDELMQRSVS